jgi:NADH dehydrogenase FAD-containing subunit
MTAQHAERQGRRAARNVAASFGTGQREAYSHKDLGFVVDLGGTQAAADPLSDPAVRSPGQGGDARLSPAVHAGEPDPAPRPNGSWTRR